MTNWLQRLFRWLVPTWLIPTVDKRGESPVSAWCIAANIIRERRYGPEGQEIRRGTKQFAPGAKVYIVSFFWGMGGENLTVVGRQRRSHRYITLSMKSKWLVNWRVELLYSPHVIDVLKQNPDTYAAHNQDIIDNYPEWMGSPEVRARAEELVRGFQKWIPTAGQVQPFTTRPPTDQTSQEQPDDG